MNDTTDSTVTLKGGHGAVAVADLLQIDAEQMTVLMIVNPNSYTVTRGQNGTPIDSHAAGTTVQIGVTPNTLIAVTYWGKDGHGYWTKA